MQKNETASPDSKARLKVSSDTYLQTCSLRSGTTHRSFLVDRAFRRPNFHDFSPFFTGFHGISSLNCTQPFHLQLDPSKSCKNGPFRKFFAAVHAICSHSFTLVRPSFGIFHSFLAVAYETRSHIGASPIRGVKLFTPEENVQRRNREAKASTMAFSNNSAATTVIRI